jgi:hypothetical protein
MKKFYLFVIFYILLFFLSCKQTGETLTIGNYIYEEKPTPTATVTVTVTPTP